jgi:predicted Zn-dependent protease with MMP-like domain
MKFSRLVRIAAETVAAEQRRLPPDIREAARAVPVHCEPEPSPDVLADGFEPDILGLFAGDPHGSGPTQSNPIPPQILLYIRNLWDYAEEDVEAFRDEVRLTYLHELGHYLGWGEDEIAARGLD